MRGGSLLSALVYNLWGPTRVVAERFVRKYPWRRGSRALPATGRSMLVRDLHSIEALAGLRLEAFAGVLGDLRF